MALETVIAHRLFSLVLWHLVILTVLPAQANSELPLKLDMSIEEVRSVVTRLVIELEEPVASIYEAEALENGRTHRYRLMFAGGRLVALRSVLQEFSGDVLGTQGRSAFESKRLELMHQFGQPIGENHITGKKGFTASNEFWTCLSFSACGEWVTRFKGPATFTSLELEGMVAAGRGRLVLQEEFSDFRRQLRIRFWKDLLPSLLGWLILALVGCAAMRNFVSINQTKIESQEK